ncbi:MAG: NAD(P)/FAD-dependent oxidoreductase [Phycisphaerales bacterium]|nr:NAD(P)/FAD-dependent oxidoreductase [Phycisphaerales bacterium]
MTACDVIVIGGGHNGLVTAAALAQKGRAVTLLEQHDVLGGLAVGDEFHPGFVSAGPWHDASTLSPGVLSLLDLDVASSPESVFAPQRAEDGPGLLLHHDPGRAAEEIARHSEQDAHRYGDYRAFIDRIRPFLRGLLETCPPTPNSIWSLIGPGLRLRRLGRADMLEFLRVGPMCMADWLNEYFQCEMLSSTLALPALAGTRTGPWSPGNATNLLRYEALSHVGISGDAPAVIRALEDHARRQGVTIRTGTRVTGIRTVGGSVQGVTLEGGETIDATVVAASCDPKQTLLDLIGPTALAPRMSQRIRTVRASGAMAMVDLALSGPLRFACRPELDVARARLVGTLDEVERAYDATKYGQYSTEPMLEVVVPTLGNPTMAPEGCHVASIMVHFAPHDLKSGWSEEDSAAMADVVVNRLSTVVPGVRDLILSRRVRTPVDLEARYRVTGGHVHHVEQALDQMIVRPDFECGRYATPIGGLYLCGSGSHPGGGLTGLPGMLAAETVLCQL